MYTDSSELPSRSWLLMLCTVHVGLVGILLIYAMGRVIWGGSTADAEIFAGLIFGPLGIPLLALQLLAVFGCKRRAASSQIVLLAFLAWPPLVVLPMTLGAFSKTRQLADLPDVALLLGLNVMNLLTLWEMGKWRRKLRIKEGQATLMH